MCGLCLVLIELDMGSEDSEQHIIVQWSKVQGMWISFETISLSELLV